MDTIRSITTAPLPASLPGNGQSGASIPVQPRRSAETPAMNEARVIAEAEDQRYQEVLRASQDVANDFVVSDRRFTIFKDANGQYVTRYTDLRSGQITYVPEPELLRRRSSYSSGPRLRLDA